MLDGIVLSSIFLKGEPPRLEAVMSKKEKRNRRKEEKAMRRDLKKATKMLSRNAKSVVIMVGIEGHKGSTFMGASNGDWAYRCTSIQLLAEEGKRELLE